MTPRADEYEQDSIDDDDDDGLKEDMAALSRACMLNDDEIQSQEDPLLATGDAIVPFTVTADSDSDEQSDLECLKRVQSLYQPNNGTLPPPQPTTAAFDDDEDDFETVRAIFKRFSAYDGGGREAWDEGNQARCLIGEQYVAKSSISNSSDADELCPDSPLHVNDAKLLIKPCGFDESCENDAHLSSQLPNKRSSFPPSAQALIDAVKKNRALQKFLRSKLIEIEAKIEQNKKLRDKVKLLKDFQVSCSKRTASALSLKKDPRVQLISSKKPVATKKSKNKKVAMCYGPDENSHVANYKMVLERFPLSLDRKKWSNKEMENLSKGIKQQFQETVLQISVDRMSSGYSPGDANDMDSIIESIKDIEITPVRIREFLPKVNWDRLASMYVAGRTGGECESRWLNCEDPLINHGPWTLEEDRSLLIIVQEKGIRNWFDIAVSLATNRIPFQCLARFQRSLNSSMINSEWTEEEDAQLCSAVAYFGDSNWQNVASVLERRTGTQCSNRWKKSICPVRKGSFTPEEDERLTVAVMLFGRKWNQIAKYVPGRIQSQCRERYLNSLDPSLKWGGWTEEEDLRLEAAITKYGYCWSKVAEDVPPRTDSQCRKRWKVICPEQVPLLKEARKRQRSLLASNFVDRESERPVLTLNDFIPLQMVVSPSNVGAESLQRKRKRQTRGVHRKVKSKRHAKRTQLCTEEAKDAGLKEERPKRHTKKGPRCPDDVQDIVPKKEKPKRHSKKARICTEEVQYKAAYSDKVKTCGGGVPFFVPSNIPKKMRSKRRARKAQILPHKPCIKSSETEDGDDMTLACFLHNKSKKKLSKCTKNASQASSSSKTKTVSKQVENQISCGEQHRLSVSCAIDGTKGLLMQAEVDSSRQVRKLESANAARKPEDAHNLNGDNKDIPLKFYVRKKKKLSQATEGRGAFSPSKLKQGSTLLHGNMPVIISDGSEPSMSKIVEDETVLHGGVAEPTTIDVAEEDAVLHGVVAEAEPTTADVVEEETVLHGGVADAKPTNIDLEENNDLLISFLLNKTKKQRRWINIRK
ncbi:myb domain protein 3r-4 [Trifolium repens]|nr:myb domain protein 3r-4 [Trifolium repens]